MDRRRKSVGNMLEAAVELMLNVHRIPYVAHCDEDLLDFYIPHKQIWLECSAKIGHIPDLINNHKFEKLWKLQESAISILGHVSLGPTPHVASMVYFYGHELRLEPKSDEHVIEHAGAFFRPGASVGQTPYAAMTCQQAFKAITNEFWGKLK